MAQRGMVDFDVLPPLPLPPPLSTDQHLLPLSPSPPTNLLPIPTSPPLWISLFSHCASISSFWWIYPPPSADIEGEVNYGPELNTEKLRFKKHIKRALVQPK